MTKSTAGSSRPSALQDAKARFGEEYRRVKGQRTGQALVQVLRNSPLRGITLDHEPTYPPIRGVEL